MDSKHVVAHNIQQQQQNTIYYYAGTLSVSANAEASKPAPTAAARNAAACVGPTFSFSTSSFNLAMTRSRRRSSNSTSSMVEIPQTAYANACASRLFDSPSNKRTISFSQSSGDGSKQILPHAHNAPAHTSFELAFFGFVFVVRRLLNCRASARQKSAFGHQIRGTGPITERRGGSSATP